MQRQDLRRIDERFAAHLPHDTCKKLPADLAEIVERWDALPTEVRAEIIRLVRLAEDRD